MTFNRNKKHYANHLSYLSILNKLAVSKSKLIKKKTKLSYNGLLQEQEKRPIRQSHLGEDIYKYIYIYINYKLSTFKHT